MYISINKVYVENNKITAVNVKLVKDIYEIDTVVKVYSDIDFVSSESVDVNQLISVIYMQILPLQDYLSLKSSGEEYTRQEEVTEHIL